MLNNKHAKHNDPNSAKRTRPSLSDAATIANSTAKKPQKQNT
jgi:hypothetical protein